jgi:C4-dicarboxylate-specific signal transduction histidine kinase
VKSVREGLNRMAKFVEGLMSIARQEQHQEQLNLNKFLENEIIFLMQEPSFQGIEIIRQWDPTIPQVEVDAGRLQQAVYNIMTNARDAVALKTEKRITITTSLSEPDGFVRLAISDSGSGLSEDDYSKVYRQNFTTKGPGHGFGLLSVKGMIKSQGGRVAVGPGPDGGACFTLELPGKRDIASAKLAAMPVLS